MVVCSLTGKAIRRENEKKRDHASRPDPRPHPQIASHASARPVALKRLTPWSPDTLVGQTIGGRYVLKSVLGEGGMGTVYEAEHVPIGRSVAVKVLHPRQAKKKDAIRRFRQEAVSAAAIGHPNICEVYDFGTHDDGSPYLVMERLVGETLADRIAHEGGLPFHEVIDTLAQMLSGLLAAHEKGIVHRDIKPENVFLKKRLGDAALVKLLDFGVSKMITPLFGGRSEDQDLTRAGMVMGTPYYLSPEQARGERDLDGRVDLYACGVILYEALTGRRPFTALNYNALLFQIMSSKPRSARDLRPALPDGFDTIIEKAMARDRGDRYGSALDFQRDIKGLRDRQGIPFSEDVRGNVRGMVHATTPPRPAPTTGSIEIPISFAGETPASGENLSVDPTDADPTLRMNDEPPSPR
jgi:serine/threonine protein kinase